MPFKPDSLKIWLVVAAILLGMAGGGLGIGYLIGGAREGGQTALGQNEQTALVVKDFCQRFQNASTRGRVLEDTFIKLRLVTNFIARMPPGPELTPRQREFQALVRDFNMTAALIEPSTPPRDCTIERILEGR